MRKRVLAVWLVTMLVAAPGFGAEAKKPPATLNGLPLLMHEDFTAGNAERWEPTDAEAWTLAKDGEISVFHLNKVSKYRAKVRSPYSIAWLKDVAVGDFVLEARVKSLGRPNDGHRDLCLFWGRKDAEHFYYVHLGKKGDAHSNSIFLVNGEPRVSIAEERTEGTPWDDKYHRVRVVRKVASGLIEVYFDDMNKPAMRAEDRTFGVGKVGIGSFDNTGYFDTVTLWGQKASQPAPVAAGPARVVLSTTLGDITLELDAEKAPITVENFLAYVDAGFYNGTVFHRVMKTFMIQGGGFTPALDKKPGVRPGIKNEWQNGLKNVRGTIAMARLGGNPDSATAQFFLNVVNNPFLDRRQRDGAAYCVFGKVVEGIETMDAIRDTPVQTHAKYGGGRSKVVPVEAVVILSAKRVPPPPI